MTEFEYWSNRINEQLAEIVKEMDAINAELKEINKEAERLEILLQDTEHSSEQ